MATAELTTVSGRRSAHFTPAHDYDSETHELRVIAALLADRVISPERGAARRRLAQAEGKSLRRLAERVRQFSGPSEVRGIVAIGVGPADAADVPCLKLFVRDERAASLLRGFDQVGFSFSRQYGIEVAVGGIPRGEGRAWSRPASGGCSIGHPAQEGGSIACLVKQDGKSFILSAAHVLARGNNTAHGTQILQPAKRHAADQPRPIAPLADYVRLYNGVDSDAAIAGPVDGKTCIPENWYHKQVPSGSRAPVPPREGSYRGLRI